MTAPSDEALYQRLIDGELPAFDLLWDRYERPLFGFVLQHVRDTEEAEDLLHEAFMTVLKARRTSGNFRAWLFQVARNLCLNRLRTQKRAGRALEAVKGEPAEEQEPVNRQLERHQSVVALHRAVERLPTPLAELYQLRVAGLSYEEMAGVVGSPLGTIKSRMHELVKRLLEELRPWTAN